MNAHGPWVGETRRQLGLELGVSGGTSGDLLKHVFSVAPALMSG